MIIRRPEGNLLEKRFTQVDWPADINYIEIVPSVMSFDDNATGVTGGQIFNILDSFDFANNENGTVWFNFNYPRKWQINRNVVIEPYYSLDGVDYSTQVDLSLKLWVINIGTSANELNPNLTENVQITSSESNVGKLSKTGLLVSNDLFISKDCVVCGSLTRNSQSDNYSGLFKLTKIVIRQL